MSMHTALARFEAQVAHLSEPDNLAKFREYMGESPRDYLTDYGGGPGGERPQLYEQVCSDLGITPLQPSHY